MERPPHARDPVCGRPLTPTSRDPGLMFRGRRWYFCDDPERGCRLAFKRAPERFADADPEAGVLARPATPPRERAPSPFRVTTGPLPRADEDDLGGT